MADDPSNNEVAPEVLKSYRLVEDVNVFAIGAFDTSVTVLSQQTRALNLVWALEHAGDLSLARVPRIAVVGAGFAGLTFAAGIVGKSIPAELTLFERRDSILPLQQGSDTRWLHPHIYDWPASGSQATSAGLPVLNWTASRASDVAVQVEASWKKLVSAGEANRPSVRLFCNATRVRVDRDSSASSLFIEWIGQERNPDEPSKAKGAEAQLGTRESFDIVVLATGFGTEVDGGISYWRNETLGQPALGKSHTEYLVSGYGDGGWIDLFRLRIMSYRQDRILGELFEGKTDFVESLREVQGRLPTGGNAIPSLMQLWADRSDDAKDAGDRLRRRLRHDTGAILHLRGNRSFSDLFDGRRASFQNQLLAWMLYLLGAFDLRVGSLDEIARSEGIADDQIIKRHGPQSFAHLVQVLGGGLFDEVSDGDGLPKDPSLGSRCRQSDSILWNGGYFDRPIGPADEKEKAHWNREYLPASTELLASAICGTIAHQLAQSHPDDVRLRLTFHRRVSIGTEVVLQQCCEYRGIELDQSGGTAGRTFPHQNGLIGQAFMSRQIVRSAGGSSEAEVRASMADLQLEEASRPMADGVRSFLAVPCLSSDTSIVVGILFLDSFVTSYFDDDDRVRGIVTSLQGFFDGITSELPLVIGSFSNVSYWSDLSDLAPQPAARSNLLEVVEVAPPSVAVDRINIDLASFVEAGSDAYSRS